MGLTYSHRDRRRLYPVRHLFGGAPVRHLSGTGDLEHITLELEPVSWEVGGGHLLHSGIEGGEGGFGEAVELGDCLGE